MGINMDKAHKPNQKLLHVFFLFDQITQYSKKMHLNLVSYNDEKIVHSFTTKTNLCNKV